MTEHRETDERAAGFFGRRKGHRLRGEQADRLDRLLPGLRIDLAQPIDDARSLFSGPVSGVHLEIGFGGGEHLIDAASRHPEIGFIGCEPFVNGVVKLLADIEARGLNNIRIHDGNAADLLPKLPVACLERAYLLYPDPWPKRRQRKRRFVSLASLNALARVLKPGAAFRFATDIDDYAGWTLARIAQSPDFTWTAEQADDWRQPFPHWPGTRYEAKARREGRTPSYLEFRRV